MPFIAITIQSNIAITLLALLTKMAYLLFYWQQNWLFISVSRQYLSISYDRVKKAEQVLRSLLVNLMLDEFFWIVRPLIKQNIMIGATKVMTIMLVLQYFFRMNHVMKKSLCIILLLMIINTSMIMIRKCSFALLNDYFHLIFY